MGTAELDVKVETGPRRVRSFIKAAFPLEKAESVDSELACIHCGRAECEFVLTIRGSTRTTRLGIHEVCVSRYGVEGVAD